MLLQSTMVGNIFKSYSCPGSLIARILFQPIEEICRVFFSKTLNTSTKGNEKASLKEASNALVSLLSVQTSFSIILVTFGSAYLPYALRILLPRTYLATSAPAVLSAWIWYIPVLAINGGLEAFMSSVASPADLNRQSRFVACIYDTCL